MQYPKGGFAGKYMTSRRIEGGKADGSIFGIELKADAFRPEQPNFPADLLGLTLVDCWCVTVQKDFGLTVRSVELIP